jgi:putative sporulation protein YtaF
VHWLAALIFGSVSNVDNLAVGLAFGLGARRISLAPNAVIAAITMLSTGASLVFGDELAQRVPSFVGPVFGGAIVAGMGVWTLATSLVTMPNSCADPSPPSTTPGVGNALDRTVSGRDEVLTSRRALPLGLALAVNNLGAGVGAGLAGVPPLTTTVIAGVLSLAAIDWGSRVGRALSARTVGRWAPFLSGLVLLWTGIAMSSRLG